METWLPYIAVAVAVLTFVMSQAEVRRRARVDYVSALEKRIEDCEADRGGLHREIDALERKNMQLMQRVMKLENGG